MMIAVWMSSFALAAAASEARSAGDTYAIVVSGIGKDPEDRVAREGVVNGSAGISAGEGSVSSRTGWSC